MTRRATRGFSLAEILVAMAMAPLFATLVYSFARSSYQAAAMQQALSEAEDTAHLSLSLITRDLRQAGFAPGGEPPDALGRAEEASVAVRADLNGDGDSDDAGESISFQEDGTRHTLTRASGGAAPQPVADRLVPGSLRFTYFDLDGTPLAAGAGLDLDRRRRVKRIDVRFAIAVPGAAAVAATASVELRNVHR